MSKQRLSRKERKARNYDRFLAKQNAGYFDGDAYITDKEVARIEAEERERHERLKAEKAETTELVDRVALVTAAMAVLSNIRAEDDWQVVQDTEWQREMREREEQEKREDLHLRRQIWVDFQFARIS